MTTPVIDVEPALLALLEQALPTCTIMPAITQDIADLGNVITYQVIAPNSVPGRYRARMSAAIALTSISGTRQAAKNNAHTALDALEWACAQGRPINGIGITRFETLQLPAELPSTTVAQQMYAFQARAELIFRAY